jgi:hypothetical protein
MHPEPNADDPGDEYADQIHEPQTLELRYDVGDEDDDACGHSDGVEGCAAGTLGDYIYA